MPWNKVAIKKKEFKKKGGVQSITFDLEGFL